MLFGRWLRSLMRPFLVLKLFILQCLLCALYGPTGWSKSLCAPDDYNTESYKYCSKCPPPVSRHSAQFDCLAADPQGQGDIRLTLTPSVTPNSNNVIMVSDWNCLKYFCVFFCNVIIRCTETFWSPCITPLVLSASVQRTTVNAFADAVISAVTP
jgi:hypothetical protein